jgi:hypothetical protein
VYEKNIEDYDGLPYVFYESVFVKYVVKKIQISDETELGIIFAFIEDLLWHGDEAIKNLVGVAVIESLYYEEQFMEFNEFVSKFYGEMTAKCFDDTLGKGENPMKKRLLDFPLGKARNLKLYTLDEAHSVHRFTEIEIHCVSNDHDILLFDDFLGEAVEASVTILKQAINRELTLPETIRREDLGALCNKYCHTAEASVDVGADHTERYLMWESVASHIFSWVYNDKDNIYLEISPMYPYHFSEDSALLSFEAFMDSYQVIETMNITECANELLRQCETLLRQCV